MKCLYRYMPDGWEAELCYEPESGEYFAFLGEGFENNSAKTNAADLAHALESMLTQLQLHVDGVIG